jgi:DamX protein
MSLADERVLELQSQTDLLERIQLLTRFGSNFISVSGAPGAGKTWIAQRYLEVWADDKNQSLLMCYPGQDDYQWRSTILTQISSHSEFQADESLVSNLSAVLEDEECNIVIVVDDAQILSEALISELWALVLEAQKRSQWTINVVLFSLPKTLDKLLSRLSDGEENKAVDLEIDILAQDDADRFFEFLVMRYVDPKMEQQLRRSFDRIKKTPGGIMALGEQKMEKRIVIRSIIGSPAKIALIILLICLLVGVGYWWMLSENQAPDILHTATQESSTQTVIPTLPGSLSSDADESGQTSDQNHASDMASRSPAKTKRNAYHPVDDSGALPPDIVAQTANVGEDDQGRRVVVSSEVVDALMEGKPEKSDTTQLHQVASEVTPPPQTILSDNAVADISEDLQDGQSNAANENPADALQPAVDIADMQEPAVEPGLQPATSDDGKKIRIRVSRNQSSAAPADERFGDGRDALMNMADRSYTLQLAAFNSVKEVNNFIRRYALQGQVNVYSTVRGNVDWYMITYKNYPTIQLARDAVLTLPDELQALGPWAKSIRQVHREIQRAK